MHTEANNETEGAPGRPKGQLQAHVIIESPMAGPGIAALIGRALLDAGADVTLDPRLAPLPDRPRNLLGLRIHMGRTVWVRQEEADRIMPSSEDRPESKDPGDRMRETLRKIEQEARGSSDKIQCLATLEHIRELASVGLGRVEKTPKQTGNAK